MPDIESWQIVEPQPARIINTVGEELSFHDDGESWYIVSKAKRPGHVEEHVYHIAKGALLALVQPETAWPFVRH